MTLSDSATRAALYRWSDPRGRVRGRLIRSSPDTAWVSVARPGANGLAAEASRDTLALPLARTSGAEREEVSVSKSALLTLGALGAAALLFVVAPSNGTTTAPTGPGGPAEHRGLRIGIRVP